MAVGVGGGGGGGGGGAREAAEGVLADDLGAAVGVAREDDAVGPVDLVVGEHAVAEREPARPPPAAVVDPLVEDPGDAAADDLVQLDPLGRRGGSATNSDANAGHAHPPLAAGRAAAAAGLGRRWRRRRHRGRGGRHRGGRGRRRRRSGGGGDRHGGHAAEWVHVAVGPPAAAVTGGEEAGPGEADACVC